MNKNCDSINEFFSFGIRLYDAGHDCKEDSVRSNTSDLENNESYSNGAQNLGEATDSNTSEQRTLRHNSRTLKSGNGNGATGGGGGAGDDNSSNDSTDEDEDEEEDDDDEMLTTSSDDNEVYSKNSKNNNGTDVKRTNQKRQTTLKTSIEHSSSKKARRSSALSIDLSLADSTADAH